MKRQLLAAIFLIASGRSAGSRDAVRAQAVRAGSWQEMLRSHAGRPTLVHFWGVTCGPCKVELPLLGKFMKEHSEIDVVMISADLVPESAGPCARWRRPGWGRRRTGFSATVLSNASGSRSTRPGRARSRARC